MSQNIDSTHCTALVSSKTKIRDTKILCQKLDLKVKSSFELQSRHHVCLCDLSDVETADQPEEKR